MTDGIDGDEAADGTGDEGMARDRAVERVAGIVETVERDRMPVPVREVWVYGDVALGLDPVERLDVYLAKDLLLENDPDREAEFVDSHGIEGVGRSVRAAWADEYPHHLRANASGHAAPERCLAAHLLADAEASGEPVHLEVCNAGFEDNVTQRLRGARASGEYERLLDPRAACLWVDGRRSETAFRKLREGSFVFPTLAEALGMLGMDETEAGAAAAAVRRYRDAQEGTTVRADVV